MTRSLDVENSDPPTPFPQPQPTVQVYQFHVLLLKISPSIWRRFLIRSDSTIADLHHVLQILMGWQDEHLHQFIIHGKHFGLAQPGCLYFSDNPRQIRLGDFQLRLKERFLYEYDLIDRWQHQLRQEVERELALWDKKLRLIEIMAALLPVIATFGRRLNPKEPSLPPSSKR